MARTEEFTCGLCGETFINEWTEEEAQAEADATFRPEELTAIAVVCDNCWKLMREGMPDLDARYQEKGL